MKNKRILILFIMMISLLLYACGKKEEQNNGNKEQTNGTGDNGNQQQQGTGSAEDNKATEQVTGTKDNAAEVTITEQVLYEEGGLKITATSLDMSEFLGPELKVLIENNTEKDLTIQARDVSINDLMIEPTFSSDVAAGKKANDSIAFFSTDLEKSAIDKIAKIELRLNIFTSDFVTVAETDPIVINTSAKDTYVQTYDDSGDMLYEKDGIKIVDKGLASDEILGPEIKLYIENNTAKAITVQVQNVSVNGFMVDPIFSADIVPGKKIYDGIMLIDLEENGVEKIKDVELSFLIFHMDTLDTIDESGPIKLKYE